MRFWLITVGEPLPIDGAKLRLLRTGQLASILTDRGHDVVWWASAFDHTAKRFRSTGDRVLQIAPHYTLVLLHGGFGYRRNISVARLVNHALVAQRFEHLSRRFSIPDAILCSLPTPELCMSAVTFARHRRVPIALDVRDLWPDIYAEAFPRLMRPAVRLALSPLFSTVSRACRLATAMIGITAEFAAWGVRKAGRSRQAMDADFPLAYSPIRPSVEEVARAHSKWDSLGVDSRQGTLTCCFIGTMGWQSELDGIIECASMIQRRKGKIVFVLAGSGPALERYRGLARGLTNVLFPGWLGAAEIHTLMQRSRLGLAPYRKTQNLLGNIPNKPIEYLSAGLPVATTAMGILPELLMKHQCGLAYDAENPASLEAILREFEDDPKKLLAMSVNALALYNQAFRSDIVYGRMADYLERLGRLR